MLYGVLPSMKLPFEGATSSRDANCVPKFQPSGARTALASQTWKTPTLASSQLGVAFFSPPVSMKRSRPWRGHWLECTKRVSGAVAISAGFSGEPPSFGSTDMNTAGTHDPRM